LASNTNKRVAVKHIRDGIKSQYPKGMQCEICGTAQDLEYHHYATLSIVFQSYCFEHNIPVDTDEQVIAMRDKFYEDNWDAVVTDGVTLCNTHHKALHKLYGKQPKLATANKQKHWVHRMFEKSTNGLQEGTDSQPTARFSKHIQRTRVDFASLI
jgi:hypothetical protein